MVHDLLYCWSHLYLSSSSVLTDENIKDRGFTDATLPCSVKKGLCPCRIALPSSCLQQRSVAECIFRYAHLLPDLNTQACQLALADVFKLALQSLGEIRRCIICAHAKSSSDLTYMNPGLCSDSAKQSL